MTRRMIHGERAGVSSGSDIILESIKRLQEIN